MKCFKFIIIISILLGVNSCKYNKEKEGNKAVENILIESNVSKAIDSIPRTLSKYKHEAMVLGTFHFNRSTDGSDVIGENHIDITTEENQAEIEILVDKLVSEFKPTIVAVEWMPKYQRIIDSIFIAYKNGSYKLGKHEALQIGFRVAQKMNLSQVYCIDNRPAQPEAVTNIDDWNVYAKALGQEKIWHEYDSVNMAHNTYIDKLQNKMKVLDYLKVINSTKISNRNKQFWVTGLVHLGVGDKYAGADLTGNWYRRNTRIFVNTRKLCKTDSERILIIYGNAHKWVLDELYDASPEFKLKQPFLTN